MRCKNCGSLNEEGRYICQNCGSPLFDEEEQIPEEITGAEGNGNEPDDEDNGEDNKKSIIIIVVLSVILVALIAGIAVSAIHNKRADNTTQPTSISELSSTDASTTKKETTTETTTKETTTEATTTTTTTTTKPKERYRVIIDIDGSGNVNGDGTYEEGEKVTLIATPATGYQFSGWYNNETGNLVASGTSYQITVDKNTHLTARFTQTEIVE